RRDGRKLPTGLLYGMLAVAVIGVILHASPLVPWFKVSVLGREESAPGAANGIHFAWTLVAMMVFMTIYTYIQGHRGTRGFIAQLAGLSVLLVGYLYLMSKTGETVPDKDLLLYYKIAANGLIVL